MAMAPHWIIGAREHLSGYERMDDRFLHAPFWARSHPCDCCRDLLRLFCLQRPQLPLQQIVVGIQPLFLKIVTFLPDAKQLVNEFSHAPVHVVLATFRARWL